MKILFLDTHNGIFSKDPSATIVSTEEEYTLVELEDAEREFRNVTKRRPSWHDIIWVLKAKHTVIEEATLRTKSSERVDITYRITETD